jgi:hypothetical protein
MGEIRESGKEEEWDSWGRNRWEIWQKESWRGEKREKEYEEDGKKKRKERYVILGVDKKKFCHKTAR